MIWLLTFAVLSVPGLAVNLGMDGPRALELGIPWWGNVGLSLVREERDQRDTRTYNFL